MQTRRMVVAAVAAALVSVPAGAQQRGRGRSAAPDEAPTAEMTRMPAVDTVVVTHHSATIGGQKIDYAATTGTYVVRDDAGTPKATFFFVAYTKDGVANAGDRPVAFVYNGGPGSASLFTHMGMGPQEVVLTPDGHGMPAPYRIRDNGDSFLDATDLVFVDAVSTGYSRPAAGQNPAQFYGVEQDADVFSDFIDLYITRSGRWDSPKFLIGESYGTTRSAELAGVLQHRHEIYLNGIVLLSTMAFAPWGADDRTEFFLPTFVTSAWYHHLLAPELEKLSLDSVAQVARTFAHGAYAQALEKGDEISPNEYARVTEELSRLTGLSPEYVDETD
ncbi:MAG: peptidase S10, partial [Gemmatimonadota bacterium]|nr:peptidase S10 [Gemmatimonadota bacterium]